MNKTVKNKIVALCVCTLAISTMAATTAFASSDDNYGFSFRIQGSVDNAQDPNDHYRDTSDNSNAWKVRLDYSGEGDGTITDFWIELANGTNASSQYSIQQGHPAYYKPANDNGDNAWVYLTAENNNFASTLQYDVSGIWDPATGIYL